MGVHREHSYDENGFEMITFYRDRPDFEFGINDDEVMGDMLVLRHANGKWYPDYDYGNAGTDGEPAKTAFKAYRNARKAFDKANEWAAGLLEAMEQGRYREEVTTIRHPDGVIEWHGKIHIEPMN